MSVKPLPNFGKPATPNVDKGSIIKVEKPKTKRRRKSVPKVRKE